ncbi:MlaD family protein [Acidaminococcus sp. NSJ-142]|jgi:phospholipid/cholesterol/gamma-HCH transport system substrate-binding protein|uniref:MlaD family protein n=1 Tax=Acidaminococcus TaxID=904 RepID=UPI001E4920F2|nr:MULTISPECIES: MlaD family protein [Acidaminococcus]MCD2435216.1 MlaD family protein [Acidaminococcus hominis]MCH4097185.1 MlaD family protein [Acidaminococcus provencensis]
MMKTDEVKVGAVTLGGLVILALMLTFLGVFSFAGKTYKLNVIFDDVNGLKAGNEVRFAGVPVGKVEDIVVDGSKVKVVMKLDEKQKIPRNSQFSIGMDGVMGTKFVTIAPPQIATGLSFKAGETITGQQSSGISKMMDTSGKVLDKLEVVVDAFSNVFGDKDVQKSMRQGFVQTGEVAKNLNDFTRSLAEMSQQNQGDIHTMVTQMRDMSVHMNSIMTQADANGATGQNVAVMAANMADASRKIKQTAESLNSVVSDPEMKKELQETVHHAKATSEKADKILGMVSDAQLQADVLYGDKKGKWRTDMGAKLPLNKDDFVYLGVSDIGDRDRLDFHYNKRLNKFMLGRAGVIEGDFGVGMDWNLSPKFKLFTDFYDFDDAKLKVGAEWAFSPNLSLLGESLDVLDNGSETAYVGLRAHF